MLAVNWNATSNRMYVTNAFCTIRDFHCDSVCIPKCHETERYCSCCCYGDLCNLDNVTQPKPPPSPPPSTDSPSVIVTSSTKVMTSSTATPSSGVHVIVIAIVATVSGVVFVAAVFVLCFYWWSRSHRDDDDDEDGAGAIALDDMESGGAMASSSSHGGNVDALNPGFDFAAVRKEKHVGIGRFAHVWRVACNDDDAYAAKIFFDVKSWNSEVDAYVKPPIKHENVLKFVAASAREKDEGETLEYWLVTEYHGMGSLMDHLRSNVVTFGELCGLMKSIARGLAYLHAETTASGSANGTTKAAIAHRDMKSRNVLMKSRSVCCISDLGLAMKFQLGTSLVEAQGQVNQNKIS